MSNPTVERARLRRYALLGITARCTAQPREGVAHLAPHWAPLITKESFRAYH